MEMKLELPGDGAQRQLQELDKQLLVLRLSAGKLEAALQRCFAPLAAVVLPAVTAAVRSLTAFFDDAAAVLAELFGFVRRSADKTVTYTGKAIKRSLAGFDQLERLSGGSGSGSYTVPGDMLAKIQSEFWAAYCDDDRAAEVMGRVYRDLGYLCDPHTAAGWAAAEDYVAETGDKTPMVVLSTASPYKFPVAVLTAIGGDTSGNEFQQMDRLSAMTGVPIPKNLAGLQGKAEKHTGVIAKDAMLEYVLGL